MGVWAWKLSCGPRDMGGGAGSVVVVAQPGVETTLAVTLTWGGWGAATYVPAARRGGKIAGTVSPAGGDWNGTAMGPERWWGGVDVGGHWGKLQNNCAK